MENGHRLPYGPRGSPFSPSNQNFLQPRGGSPYRQQWIPHHNSNSSPTHVRSPGGYHTPTPSPDFIPLSGSPDLSTPPSSGKSPTWGNRRFSNDRHSGSGGQRLGNFRGRGNFNRNFSRQHYSPGNSHNKRFNTSSPRDCNPGRTGDIRDYITPHILEDPWKELMDEHERKTQAAKPE